LSTSPALNVHSVFIKWAAKVTPSRQGVFHVPLENSVTYRWLLHRQSMLVPGGAVLVHMGQVGEGIQQQMLAKAVRWAFSLSIKTHKATKTPSYCVPAARIIGTESMGQVREAKKSIAGNVLKAGIKAALLGAVMVPMMLNLVSPGGSARNKVTSRARDALGDSLVVPRRWHVPHARKENLPTRKT